MLSNGEMYCEDGAWIPACGRVRVQTGPCTVDGDCVVSANWPHSTLLSHFAGTFLLWIASRLIGVWHCLLGFTPTEADFHRILFCRRIVLANMTAF